MYTYTKILYVKCSAYIEVFVYYSRKGEKFRPTTGVKVLGIKPKSWGISINYR